MSLHPLTHSPLRGEGERSVRVSTDCSSGSRSPRRRASKSRAIASTCSRCIRPRVWSFRACTSWEWRITRFPGCARRRRIGGGGEGGGGPPPFVGGGGGGGGGGGLRGVGGGGGGGGGGAGCGRRGVGDGGRCARGPCPA